MMRTLVVLLLPLAGCVFHNADAPRFYRPAASTLDATSAATGAGDAVPVRLRVRATPILRERIVWRSSSLESGLYEQRQWRELPARYVERALAVALSRTPGVRLDDEPAAATLRVEITAFDEVVAPQHGAQITGLVSLRSASGRRIVDRVVSVEQRSAGSHADALAVAMGTALDRFADEVAQVAAGAVVTAHGAAHGGPRSTRRTRAAAPVR